jgi:hypothetical protein
MEAVMHDLRTTGFGNKLNIGTARTADLVS